MGVYLTQCEKHGISPCYVVCIHVLKGVTPAYVEAAREDFIGQAVCGECHSKSLTVDDGNLICAGHFAELTSPEAV